MIAGCRGRHHDCTRAIDVVRIDAGKRHSPRRTQICKRRFVGITSGDRHAALPRRERKRTHPGTADAEEMNGTGI